MKYLIIGNSATAIGGVEGIRKFDNEGEITVITREPHFTYSRPLISYLLLGKTDEKRMKYRDDDFYLKNSVNLMAGVTALEINPVEKTVSLDRGENVSYDKLLVAVGSSPFIPPITGIEEVKNKFTFMTLDDARSLEKVLTPNSRVLIIGAGLIGLKCAEGIAARVSSITVVDLASRILPSILDDESATMVQKHIESEGITFKLEQKIKSINKKTAVLSGGEEITFDILIIAAGVIPNTSLIEKAGGKVNRGIVTDKLMQTSLKDIYAAGDCIEGFDVSSGQHKIMALLPNAYIEGECAGINMTEKSTAVFVKAIPMNAIGFFGLHIITAGNYNGEAYYDNNNGYKKLFYFEDKLNGYILVGCVEKAGIYTSLIRERTSLSEIDFGLICEKPGLMAFSRDERNRKLGSEV